jgi:hypothetical protein
MATYGKAEYVQVFERAGQIEISKFDKQARQDYVLSIPAPEYYNRHLPGNGVPSNLPEEQREFLRRGLTPAEQRIIRDPDYQQALDSLVKAPQAALSAHRAAILERACQSQLEPYDYNLSVQHQAFNDALRQRPDVNQSIKEIDWMKDISQAQFRSQASKELSFNPEMRTSSTPDRDKKERRDANVTSSITNAVQERFKNVERIASAIVGDSAKTSPAQVDGGIYRGQVIAETQDLFLQRLSSRSVVTHLKGLFQGGQPPRVGANICVSYSNGQPTVRPVKERSKFQEMGR